MIEGIEDAACRFCLGVQWHPELLLLSVPANLGLYRAFVKAAAKTRAGEGRTISLPIASEAVSHATRRRTRPAVPAATRERLVEGGVEAIVGELAAH